MYSCSTLYPAYLYGSSTKQGQGHHCFKLPKKGVDEREIEARDEGSHETETGKDDDGPAGPVY